MRMHRKSATAVVAMALAVGLGACGEDREGDVQFQSGTGTETTGTGTETTGTGTTGTETTGTETTGTETSP
jgi:uncharacterized lipoprotein YehR (DUF1307 family)